MRWIALAFAGLLVTSAALILLRVVGFLAVEGQSMLPAYKPGDLVVISRLSAPEVGKVVAYRDRDAGKTFVHRIISHDEDGRFTLKGDNNSFVDSYRPLPAEIQGGAVLRIPAVGRVIANLRQPVLLGLLGAGLALIALAPSARRQPRRLGSTPEQGVSAASWPVAALYLGCLVFLCSSALLVYSLLLPTRTSAEETVGLRHTGQWTYTSPSSSSVFDDGAAHAGEPLFWRSNDEVTVQFSYRLAGDAPFTASGTLRLLAIFSSPTSGWRRTMEIAPRQAFSGPEAQIAGRFQLSQLQDIARQIAAETGAPLGATVLELIAEVSVSGQADGTPYSGLFRPALVFQGDTVGLRPNLRPSPDQSNPLSPQAVLNVPVKRVQPTHLPGPLRALSVEAARVLGAAVAIIAAGDITAALAYLLRQPWAERLLIFHEHALLVDQLPECLTVAVGDRRRLIGLARRLSLPLLVERGTGRIGVLVEGSLLLWTLVRPGQSGQPDVGGPQDHRAIATSSSPSEGRWPRNGRLL